MGEALRYASDDLRADPAVVLDAVQQYPLALGHARGAALALRADRTVVLAAVRKDEKDTVVMRRMIYALTLRLC